MPDIHIHLHFPESGIMSALNQILDRIAQSEAKADAESAEVKTVLDGLKAEIAGLKATIAEGGLDPVAVSAALDRLDSKIDSIYTPEPVEPPAPAE